MFEEARAELMRGEESKADAQIEKHVHNLNSELEPLGFPVVPIWAIIPRGIRSQIIICC